MKKLLSFLAVLILCCSVTILAQDPVAKTLTMSIPLAGGFNVSCSSLVVEWDTIYPPLVEGDWVPSTTTVDWAFSWRCLTATTQKLICYSDGLTSSLGGAYILDPAIYMKQIWSSSYSPLNGLTLPGPEIGVDQEICLFSTQRGFQTASLTFEFLNSPGDFSEETYSGTFIYTMLENI